MGVVIRKWEPHSAARIFTVAFLAIILLTSIAKIAMTMIQRRRMDRARKQLASLSATASTYTGSKSYDSYDTAKTINKLLYGASNDNTESYRQNDVLY